MTREEMEEVLSHVSFNGWMFMVQERRYLPSPTALTESLFYLQARFYEADITTGERTLQCGRKWILSEHMTKSEVVATAFKAVLTAMEHEVREQFRYRGRMVFGPHFDVDVLHGVATRASMDVREDPSSVERD
jgi:hypothetical protein